MPRILDVEKIGSFKIIEKIGEGGMAIIYKAVQPSLKRTVVIKKLKDPNNEIIQRFKKEAFVSASFSQENVLSIYDFIYYGRSYYLVMEYVDGFDLHDIFDYMAPFSTTIAALIIREVAKGLEYTHSKNVIHRDIKPSNILISREGTVKLIDFGVAKDEAPSKLTSTGMIIGTPSYMSPEQANGEKINNQSDIYSLGVLFYEIVTGYKPFSGDTNSEIFANIAKGKFPSPRKYRSDLPYRLINIIKKCMKKNRDKRYQNTTELIRDMDKFISWQVQSDKNIILSKFVHHYEKLEQSTTLHAIPLYFSKSTLTWAMTAAIILLTFFAIFQMSRFFENERFSDLTVKANSSEFSVFIDNEFKGKSNSQQIQFSNILPGNHELVISGVEKYGIHISDFSINPNGNLSRNIMLPVRNTHAKLNIATEPLDANIYLDGHLIGTSPLNDIIIRSGSHDIQVLKEGYNPVLVQKKFKNDQSYSLSYELKKK